MNCSCLTNHIRTLKWRKTFSVSLSPFPSRQLLPPPFRPTSPLDPPYSLPRPLFSGNNGSAASHPEKPRQKAAPRHFDRKSSACGSNTSRLGRGWLVLVEMGEAGSERGWFPHLLLRSSFTDDSLLFGKVSTMNSRSNRAQFAASKARPWKLSFNLNRKSD